MNNTYKDCMYKISGVVQHYAWGGQHFIAHLLEKPVDPPAAEYWLGTHPLGTATVHTEHGPVPLTLLIEQAADMVLGAKAFRYENSIPFLLKVLDVHEMLSIQVHPSREEAEKGFLLEEEKGIAANAAHRSYKDKNHKPEMLVALSDFWLLHGFKPEDEMRRCFDAYPSLSPLRTVFAQGDYKTLYEYVMNVSPAEADAMIDPLVKEALEKGGKNKLTHMDPLWWVASYCMNHPEQKPGQYDLGLLSIFLFNIVHLRTGEALFQAQGLPHAYLKGQCVELMANSDNVLRGGLTPKYIDVPQLLKHTQYQPTHPKTLSFEIGPFLGKLFEVRCPDFALSQHQIHVSNSFSGHSQSAEILLVTKGCVRLHQECALDLQQGEAAIIFANQRYTITGAEMAEVFRAFVPVPEA